METNSPLLVLRAGNPLVTGVSPHKGAVLDVFFLFTPEQMVEQTIETPVIWNAIALIMTSL